MFEYLEQMAIVAGGGLVGLWLIGMAFLAMCLIGEIFGKALEWVIPKLDALAEELIGDDLP